MSPSIKVSHKQIAKVIGGEALGSAIEGACSHAMPCCHVHVLFDLSASMLVLGDVQDALVPISLH